MIIYRNWQSRKMGRLTANWDGWFLFGFIPLYLRRREAPKFLLKI